VAAVNEIDVRARVRGFLIEQTFRDGQLVRDGDVLYRIDPSTYEIRLKESKGELARAQARLSLAKRELLRARELLKKEVVSQAILDQREEERDAAAAEVVSAEAAVAAAELDLSYCTVYAPLTGRIGRSRVDVGNLVGEGGQDTVLARIVQVNPVHVLFNPTEQERLRVLRDAREGRVWAEREFNLPVEIILGDGSRYPHRGLLDFVDPAIDATRGTITVRAVVPNPDGDLKPGEYVRVVTVWPEIPEAVVVPERAVQDEQGGSYVLVVAADDRVEQRPVTLGASHEGMLHIAKGLAAGERVVVEGVQKVRPGSRVTTRESEVAQDPPKNTP
jgi:membrane fusion protein (multidrug efflux system)